MELIGKTLDLKINPLLDIDLLREQYKIHKQLVIEDFLDESSAQSLYDFYVKYMPKDWWYISYAGCYEEMRMDRMTEEFMQFDESIKSIYEDHHKALGQDKFCYVFNRTNSHHHTCRCGHCQYVEFIKSPFVLGLLSSITELSLSSLGEFFASEFTSGQFLSKHHDVQKGKLSVVYSLAKMWDPTFGGNLYVLKDDWKTIDKVVLSTFNRLNIMEIPDGKGKPHFVSQVSEGVKQHRLSITGWIS